MALSNTAKAGTVLFVGVLQFALFEMIAEFLFPGYSVAGNYISDLGAFCNSTCTVYQPTSMIFNGSIIIGGALVLVSLYFLRSELHWKPFLVALGLSGIGMILVGTFTEQTGVVHSIVSAVAFISIGVAAILAYRIQKPPLSYFSVILGVIGLVATALLESNITLGIGVGGMERLIVYPVLFWALTFAGFLIGAEELPEV